MMRVDPVCLPVAPVAAHDVQVPITGLTPRRIRTIFSGLNPPI